MTRVILDVPKEKMQPFIKAILDIGISRHAISADPDSATSSAIRRYTHLRNISKSFILFDWEYYSNELEYE